MQIINFITQNILLLIVSAFVLFIIIFVVISNYKKIKTFFSIITATFKAVIIFIGLPLKALFTHFVFDFRNEFYSIFLAIKLSNNKANLIKRIFLNSFVLLLFILLLIFVLYSNNDNINQIILMFEGAIISIWATHLFTILKDINNTKINIKKTYTCIKTCIQALALLYDPLIGFFPYSDDLFRKEGKIIYVTPKGHSNLNPLEENTAMNFCIYFNLLDNNELFKTFDETKARNFITNMKMQNDQFQYINVLLSSCSEFVPNEIVDLYYQTLTQYYGILTYSERYKWDNDIKLNLSNSFRVFISKLINTILFLQNERKKYDNYISFISNPPQMKTFKDLDSVIKSNQKFINK